MNHLLALSIGPVQEFIAAARRTRDLWFGSYLLSEVSKAAAKAVADSRGELVFPAPLSSNDLSPDSDAVVANVILAVVSDGNPQQLVDSAQQAVAARWRTFADDVSERHADLIDRELWAAQVDDVVEFFAAWVPLDQGEANYRLARSKVMRLLAGRKGLRDFRPAVGRAGVWKSSLDGLRESVLRDSVHMPGKSVRRRGPRSWRLKPGEHLDVVGLTKRASPADRYPSVSRVAADPWLRGCAPEQLRELVAACEAAVDREAITRIDVSARGCSQYREFPFDGTVIYPSRHAELLDDPNDRPSLAELQQTLRRIGRRRPEPSPYLAILVADGDRMGATISRIGSKERHQEFSRALAEFASRATVIVREHSGVPVYAGGDDVLAFLPGDRCLACARALHDEFAERLGEFRTEDSPPTLSVGIALAHFMEPMEDLLEYGRIAEANAKRPGDGDVGSERDGLAVHLVKRGGAPITVRANWTSNLDRHLWSLVDLINARAVSGRVAYDLRYLAEFYRPWEPEEASEAVRLDVLRVLDAKRPEGGGRSAEIRRLVDVAVAGGDAAEGVDRLSRELLVAKMLAEIARQNLQDEHRPRRTETIR